MASFIKKSSFIFVAVICALMSQGAFAGYGCVDADNYGSEGNPKWHRQSGPWTYDTMRVVRDDARHLALEACSMTYSRCRIKYAEIDYEFCNQRVWTHGSAYGNWQCAAYARACGYSYSYEDN